MEGEVNGLKMLGFAHGGEMENFFGVNKGVDDDGFAGVNVADEADLGYIVRYSSVIISVFFD